MKTTRKPRTKPSQRTELARYKERAHAIITGKLAELDRPWHWLARECQERGLASEAVIMQWKRGRNSGVGVGLWLAILDILEEASDA